MLGFGENEPLEGQMRGVTTTVAIATMTIALGCGADTSGGAAGGGGGASAPSIDQVDAALVGAFCSWITRCGSGPNGLSFSSSTACASFFASQLDNDEEVAAVKAGTMTYDAASAGKCIAAISALACDATLKGTPDPSCDTTFVGTVELGQACMNKECKPELVCVTDNEKSGCAGVCVQRVVSGASCEGAELCPAEMKTCNADSNPCVSGDSCKPDDKGKLLCQPVAAAKVAKAGENCEQLQCDAGLWCDWGNQTAKTCKSTAKIGEKCSNAGPMCDAGLLCDVPDKSDEGTCKEPAAEGAACDLEAQVKDGAVKPCGAGLKCSVVGLEIDFKASKPDTKCVKMVEMGGACTDVLACRGIDAWCKPAADKKTGVCSPLPADGASCALAFPLTCQPQLTCVGAEGPDTTKGTCRAEQTTVGGECFDQECGGDLLCGEDEKCHTAPKAGEDCVKDIHAGSTCAAGLQCGSDNKCADSCGGK